LLDLDLDGTLCANSRQQSQCADEAEFGRPRITCRSGKAAAGATKRIRMGQGRWFDLPSVVRVQLKIHWRVNWRSKGQRPEKEAPASISAELGAAPPR